MLDLRNVLELINHTFNNGSLSEHNAIRQVHRQPVLGIGSELGDQLDAKSLKEQFIQGMRDVAFIAENLPEQLMDQSWNRLAIIHIARGQQHIEQFAAIIDNQVQFEAEKPTGRSLSSTCQPCKYLMRGNALVNTHI